MLKEIVQILLFIFCLVSFCLTARGDLGETQKEIDNRYAIEGEETTTEKAEPLADTLTKYRLDFGRYAQVWFRGGKSRMECHGKLTPFTDSEIKELKTRNAGDSSWILLNSNPKEGTVWGRKDGKVLAWTIRLRSGHLCVFQVGYKHIVEAQFKGGAFKFDKKDYPALWQTLSDYFSNSNNPNQ